MVPEMVISTHEPSATTSRSMPPGTSTFVLLKSMSPRAERILNSAWMASSYEAFEVSA